MYFYPHEKVKYNYYHLICIKIIAENQLEALLGWRGTLSVDH